MSNPDPLNADTEQVIAEIVVGKRKEPYIVAVDDNGCLTCGAGKQWTVVGPDDTAASTSWEDEEDAQAHANAMNAAFEAGAAQRDELLACLRRMCGMYSAYSRRLAPLLAEDEGTIWTFERANSLALEAIAKAEGR